MPREEQQHVTSSWQIKLDSLSEEPPQRLNLQTLEQVLKIKKAFDALEKQKIVQEKTLLFTQVNKIITGGESLITSMQSLVQLAKSDINAISIAKIMNYYLKYQIWFSVYYVIDATKNRSEREFKAVKADVDKIVQALRNKKRIRLNAQAEEYLSELVGQITKLLNNQHNKTEQNNIQIELQNLRREFEQKERLLQIQKDERKRDLERHKEENEKIIKKAELKMKEEIRMAEDRLKIEADKKITKKVDDINRARERKYVEVKDCIMYLKQSISKEQQNYSNFANSLMAQINQKLIQYGEKSISNLLSQEGPAKSQRGLFFLSNIFLGYDERLQFSTDKDYNPQRQYLVKILEEYKKKPIIRTKLIYEYDQNLGQFHSYIDKVDDYVVIVKLVNGFILTCYAQLGLVEDGLRNVGQGLILSLTQKSFVYFEPKVKEGRATSYNQFFIVFGNDELKIQLSRKEVTSYLGSQYAFYRPKSVNRNAFIGTEDQAIKFISLEVHKVMFKQQE